MLTKVGLCNIEYKGKFDNLYYDSYIEANVYAIQKKQVIYNSNCLDNNWDYQTNNHKYNRIGIRVITKDDHVKYIKPHNYELTEYIYDDYPYGFRTTEDASHLCNRVSDSKDYETIEIIEF